MSQPPTIQQALSQATIALKQQDAGAESAPLEAQLLLQDLLQVNRAWLISHANDALQTNIYAEFQGLLQRRIAGEPIAYILGYREFYGLKLKVSPATLIPRPDTETLVEAALEKTPRESMYSILDLGTGTGAIALAIAQLRPQTKVTAVDASVDALNIANENARNLNITNVSFKQSDWFSALTGDKFDVIVSNPPYIEAHDAHLKQGDLRFEPLSALASGSDGLDDIRRIIQTAPQYLNEEGWLLLEHGYNQADAVAKLMNEAGFKQVQHRCDLANIQRVTLAQR